MVVYSNPIKLDKDALFKKGFTIRSVSGTEHPRSLLQEITHGRQLTAGKPCVLAYGGLVFAALSGKETHDNEDDCRRAINGVRAHRGLAPIQEHPY